MLGFDALGRLALGQVADAATVTVEGVASQTVAAVTQSATGAVKVQGAASQTAADVTQSATGAVKIAAAASQTVAAVTQSATATVALKGSASQTVDAVTQTATGAVAIAGNASQGLADITQVAASTLLLQGAAAQTIDAAYTSLSTSIVQLDPSGGGDGISGGQFSRGKWRKIKEEEQRRKEAAAKTEKHRKQQILADALAAKAKARAEVLAQRKLEATRAKEAALSRMLSGAQDVATGSQALQQQFANAGSVQRMIADAVARQRVEQDDEDEAIALLLLAA